MKTKLVSKHRHINSGPSAWIGLDAYGLARRHGTEALLIYAALCILESEANMDERSAFQASFWNIADTCGLRSPMVKKRLPLLVEAKLVEMVSAPSDEIKKMGLFAVNTFRLTAYANPKFNPDEQA